VSTRTCRTCLNPFDAGRGRANYCSDACRCGTVAGYLAGCRCTGCRAARARRTKQDRCTPATMVPGIGVTRRLRALAALGYDWQTLGGELGVSRDQVRQWASNTTVVTQPTYVLVVAAYDRLSMVPPPTHTVAQRCNVTRARNRAQAERWAVPLAWDEGTLDDPTAKPVGRSARAQGGDHAVVERVLAGEYRLPATKAEREEVAGRWHAAGRSLAELERLTGWNVARYFRITDQTASAA
jgi:hypothetical protein